MWVKKAGLCLEVRARIRDNIRVRIEAIAALSAMWISHEYATSRKCMQVHVEENVYVHQEASGSYMHNRTNETRKFLSMCNQKIIQLLQFCITRTWLIISTTCSVGYSRPPTIPILHLSLLCYSNRFWGDHQFNQHNECWIFTPYDTVSENLSFKAKIPVDNDCVCLCVCVSSFHDAG